MFEVTSKSFKRNDTFYITLNVKNTSENDLVGADKNQIFVRPRFLECRGRRQTDPQLGRSEEVVSISAGQDVTVKIKIPEKDLFDIFGGGEYVLAYGVVHEWLRWFEPLTSVQLDVAGEVEEAPTSVKPMSSWASRLMEDLGEEDE